MGHEEILGDIVRVVRTFRPDIIISRFSGTPMDAMAITKRRVF